ncbi:isochorismatase family protein [Croceicoccus ponticola]|uniref:Isochorismatase family protein n=1 Tax=Croceicoccus ponticola TaxID=2217664 RepID=A0A437GWW8_9SPHN|nr:isochorismatase family protein [Croceicoccus ponticola]RVQ66589.1 isochorismatase family protein [Croceicoccus ponticola]
MASGNRRAEIDAGPFVGRLQPGQHPALLLVDMVEAYLQPESPLYCETAKAAATVAQQLVSICRANNIPVIFTNVEYEPGGANGGVFYRKAPVLKVFDRGSELGAFPPGLKPAAGEIVLTKQYPSAFFETGLAQKLKARGVDTLLIGGYSTSGCVRASVLDAMQYGFIPFVVQDACADRHPDTHSSNLFDLKAKYAEVIEAADLDLVVAAKAG